MTHRLYIHSHIHNNNLQPDSAVLVKITDDVWSKDHDEENLAARYIGDNLYIIVSIPHFVYGFQRYDVVEVDKNTDIITKLKYRSKNTSARFIFNTRLSEGEQVKVMQHLVDLGCVLDPSKINMIGVDLDGENSKDSIKMELNKLLDQNLITDWEYVVQS